ncbi:MAG: hypothetical protein LBC37_05405, partial [Zoogloeaceae bacterium]|nr:hypothetical protein [Zoogloeaceae bacterium]
IRPEKQKDYFVSRFLACVYRCGAYRTDDEDRVFISFCHHLARFCGHLRLGAARNHSDMASHCAHEMVE